jgi:hypothetical protein
MKGRPGWIYKRRHQARVEFKKRQLARAIDLVIDRLIEKHFEVTSDGNLKIKSTPPRQ